MGEGKVEYMDVNLKGNELNQLAKGTRLFKRGERINFIGMVVKGSIGIWNEGIRRSAKSGQMIAVADIFADEYISDYVVEEDTIFYAFPAFDSESLESFLNSNFDYRGIVIHSMERELVDYLEDRERLLKCAMESYRHLKKHYEIAVKEGMTEDVPEQYLKGLPENVLELECSEQKLNYYRESSKVSLDIKKQFYYKSDVMALYQAGELSYVIQQIEESGKEIIKYIEEIYELFFNSEGTGLFDKEVRFARLMKKNGKFHMEQFIRINDTKDRICSIYDMIKKRTGKSLIIDKKYLEDKTAAILNATTGSSSMEEKDEELPIGNPIVVLKNSLQQILKFAGIEGEEQKEITDVINKFVQVSDRLSTQDDVRRLKKQITTHYFKLYKICLFKWFENEKIPLAVKLFLNYGYMDERLLDEEQILFFCDMVNEKPQDLPCKIYRMPEWLKEIYEGRKETSRNSFEQDFRDQLREERRTGKITEKQEREYLNDNTRKVIFEVDNMFVSNNKIANGKLSTYAPILYKDQFYGDLERLYVTKRQLNDAILELEKKDFTTFYREVLYTNPKIKVDKEYVIKHVYPDVIIAPVYGSACSMWQEITGKKRDTPARFIFPIIAETDIDKLVTKAFGRFHWEYCRCEQGVSWNNIQQKSLTSEYMDYIQYYRKNHDLSEEKREKIKIQIQRARNNSREIFLSDYELWIYSESRAAMKLNKVSRQILATYCPFNKEIRESLKTNATYADAMMRQQRKFGEKAHEWELRIRRRENNNLVVPEEFYETYNYYAKN